jgi:succinyl-CoA synthetase beta subunit
LKLFEYEAKEILKHNDIPTPKGYLVTSGKQAKEAAGKIGKPVVLKAQVLLSGRGKAGGIVFASSEEEVRKSAEKLLHTEIKNTAVRMLLVEEKIRIKRELYFGVTIDRQKQSYVLIASSDGGMEVEEIAVQSPETILRTLVDPILGFHLFQARKIAKKIGYDGKQELELAIILENIYRLAMKEDAIVLEINPLVETVKGRFVAADARIIIDDIARRKQRNVN